MSLFKKVEHFNRSVTGIPIPRKPARLSPERKQWFLTAMREELQEFADAETIEDELDAILDAIYFCAGRVSEMGIEGMPDFDAVHTCNMEKQKGTLSKRPGSKGHDAVKPEGWKPPRAILEPIKRKILVLGHARHGKDTVAELLRDRHGFSFTSSSLFCAEHVVYPSLKATYDSAEECFEDRNNHRAVWYNIISSYLADDPALLGRNIFAEHDIYVGVRSDDEYTAIMTEGLADFVVWVDASNRLPDEDESSFTLTDIRADFIIDNNGDESDLTVQVDKLAQHIFGGEV